MTDCTHCKHCLWDYTDSCYDGRYWFPMGCEKDRDPEDCEEFEEDGWDE